VTDAAFPNAPAIMNISKDSTHLPLNQRLGEHSSTHAGAKEDASEPGLESRPQQENVGVPPQDALQQAAMLSLPPALVSTSSSDAIQGKAPASIADASDPTLCRQRAEQGDAQAQVGLGAMYLLGKRVARDVNQAFMSGKGLRWNCCRNWNRP
jgi:TPR repeat protein